MGGDTGSASLKIDSPCAVEDNGAGGNGETEYESATEDSARSGNDNDDGRFQRSTDNVDSDSDSDAAARSFLPGVVRRTRATSAPSEQTSVDELFRRTLPVRGGHKTSIVNNTEEINRVVHSIGAASKKNLKPRCPSCNREFASLNGLKYHVDKRVCERDVKSLGDKAKQSLMDIQSKRPVIRRVDAPIVPVDSVVGPSSSTPSSPTRKRKRPMALPRKQKVPCASVYQEVDRWVPDASALPVCTKETRSTIVQLHGLPAATTPDHIINFFSGLNPDKVWMLPPIPIRISSLDANHDVLRKKGLHIERLCPRVRVMVKFRNASEAELAACRSGELLLIQSEEESDMKDPNVVGASIVVTHWKKDMASYFIRNHLYIEGKRNVRLAVTLDATEASLAQRSVLEIIAAAVIRDLKLSSADVESGLKTALLAADAGQCPSIFGEPQYFKAVEKHNQLLNAYNNLLPFQQCALDPTLVQSDAKYRLTTSALEFLKRDLGQAEQRLLQARRWRILQLPSFRIRQREVAS